MERKPLESSVVRTILRYLRSLPSCKAVKVPGTYRAGTPDILGCLNGRAFVLEVKRPGGRATALQEAELSAWKQAGALAGVVRSVEDVRKLLGGENRAQAN